MKSFNENRKYIENAFEEAVYDRSTGLDADILFAELKKIQETETDEPRQLVCAKAYAYLLDNVQLEINEHTPFSVKINTGVEYGYWASHSVFPKALFFPQREKILKEKLPREYELAKTRNINGFGDHPYTDFWHTLPDWNFVINQGFSGILEFAENSKKRLLESNHKESQIIFLDSVIICYKAIHRLMERMYNYSLAFNVPEFSKGIKHLISSPPRDLYEVMLFSILYLYFEEIGIERGRTLGNIDTLYFPFYQKSLENGATKEEIEELVKYFYMHWVASRRSNQQPFAIGGGDDKGNDYTNELSHLLLDAYDALNIFDPKIHIRYHKNLDDALLTKGVDMIRRGNSSICILGDEAVFRGYEKIGIPRSESKDYAISGCYEPILMGKEEGLIVPNRFNLLKAVELALHGGKDLLSGLQLGYESPLSISSFDEFYDIFIKHFDNCMDFEIDYIQKQEKFSTLINPTPIYSSSFRDCLEKGMDVHEFPLKYNNISLKIFALASAVDALVAIKKFVFDEKIVSLDEMRKAVSVNWEGYEWLREKILHDKDKYGNNRPIPDELTAKITKHAADRYLKIKPTRGGSFRLGLDSIYIHIDFGETTGASPDGRRHGDPVSKNLCATDGMDRGGITAYMQSVLKIDSAGYLDAAPLDFILHPSAVKDEKGLECFKSLIKIFLDQGGFAIQGNVFGYETLKDAQANPQKYSTLQVRVCGWNEYFVNLRKETQDSFIKQCKGAD